MQGPPTGLGIKLPPIYFQFLKKIMEKGGSVLDRHSVGKVQIFTLIIKIIKIL